MIRFEISLAVVSFLLLMVWGQAAFTLDLTKSDKHGNLLQNQKCNKDTTIDFSFSSSSILTCTSSSCSSALPTSSSLAFLDVNGNDLTLYLQAAYATKTNFYASSTNLTSDYSFVFEFKSTSSNTVEVIVPFTFTASIQDKNVDLTNSNRQSGMNSLAGLTNSMLGSGFSLSAFNFLNLMDANSFYHVTNADKTTTILVSSQSYYLGSSSFANIPSTNASYPTILNTISADYANTGDRLCWGSSSAGFFQTHMRESIPLWFFVVSVLLFWIYVLLCEEITAECYDRTFRNRKWTSWSLYSLFWLNHEEVFTKMSRASIFYINIIWQCCVLASIYSTVGSTFNNGIIIWSAIVAYIVSIPIPYILGGLFLTKVYQTELEKMEIQLKMKGGLVEKKQLQIYEKEIYGHDARIYGLYYILYAIFIGAFILFTIISVYVMQKPGRTFYHLHYYWLASIGITMVLDHLVVDPIMTAIFGDRQFYQKRGYFFDFNITEVFKQLD